MAETKVPSIPAVPTGLSSELTAFLNALRETVEVREGKRGQALDANVTFRDLITAGVATEVSPALGNRTSKGITLLPFSDGSELDTTIPPAPQNVTASGGVGSVFVQWDAWTANSFNYAEVWRNGADDLSSAVRIGTTTGTIFTEAVLPGTTYYYWIRFVNKASIEGPYHDFHGAAATTALDPEYVIGVLSGQINQSMLAQDLRSSIGALNASYVLKVKDDNGAVGGFGYAWENGTSQFLVSADRFALLPPTTPNTDANADPTVPFIVQSTAQTVNGVTAPAGTYIKAAYIQDGTITTAKIGNAQITNAKIDSLSADKITTNRLNTGIEIYSANYYATIDPETGVGSNPTGNGWRIKADGNAEFKNAIVRGQVQATYGAFYGAITSGSDITWTNGTGLFAGYSTTDGQPVIDQSQTPATPYQFRVGNLADRYVQWDGNDLQIKAAGLTIENGNATFSGKLEAAGGEFAGILKGATGTFDGSLSANVLTRGAVVAKKTYSTTGTFALTINNSTTFDDGVVLEDLNEWNDIVVRVTVVGGGGDGGAAVLQIAGPYSVGGNTNWYAYAYAGGGGGEGGEVIQNREFRIAHTSGVPYSNSLTIKVGGAAGESSVLGTGISAICKGGANGGSATLSNSNTSSVKANAGLGGATGGGSNGGNGVAKYFTSQRNNDGTYSQTGSGGWASGGAGGSGWFGYGKGGNGGSAYWDGTRANSEGGAQTSTTNATLGTGGFVLVEVYNPNFVVLNDRYSKLIGWMVNTMGWNVPANAR